MSGHLIRNFHKLLVASIGIPGSGFTEAPLTSGGPCSVIVLSLSVSISPVWFNFSHLSDTAKTPTKLQSINQNIQIYLSKLFL